MTAVAPFSKGVTEAAARGWDPISANFLMPVWVKSHWPRYVEGCERVGRPADPANWRVAKSIFVAEDDRKAREYAMAANSPYRQYYGSLGTKLIKNGRAELFKTSRDMPDSDVTLDYICDNLVIWGSPNKVADEFLAFREQVGEFGTLLYAGKDWLDRDLGRRSMILLAEQVMPQVNAALANGRARGRVARLRTIEQRELGPGAKRGGRGRLFRGDGVAVAVAGGLRLRGLGDDAEPLDGGQQDLPQQLRVAHARRSRP